MAILQDTIKSSSFNFNANWRTGVLQNDVKQKNRECFNWNTVACFFTSKQLDSNITRESHRARRWQVKMKWAWYDELYV